MQKVAWRPPDHLQPLILSATPELPKTYTRIPSTVPTNGFNLKHVTGDLASIGPNNAVLIHACNCFGKWGTGVAAALTRKYPDLVQTCQQYIREYPTEALLGTCVIIWAEDKNSTRKWVACLFTSEGYGKQTKGHPGRSSVADITKYTKSALADLRTQLEYYRDSTPEPGEGKPDVNELWACKFNSGFFGVDWTVSEQVLKEVFSGWAGEMKIVSPE
jgi:ADP-ribose 1''-phosphate phosphatase